MAAKSHFSPRKASWQRFKGNHAAFISLWLVVGILFIAVLKDLLATDLPLYASYKGQSYYPAFASIFNPAASDSFKDPHTQEWIRLQFDIVQWKNLELENVWWAPIPWSPSRPDNLNSNYASPFEDQRFINANGDLIKMPHRYRHILGTNAIGQDVAAGLVHGAAISLKVGLFSAAIAALIGILLGSVAGFLGDDRFRMRRIQLIGLSFGICLGFFYGFFIRRFSIADAFGDNMWRGLIQLSIGFLITAAVVIILLLASQLFINKKSKLSGVPVDTIVMKVIEILNSMPRLLLILSIAAIAERSIEMVILVIGLTMWTGIARITRAEMLRLRNLEFIEASRALGLKERRIILAHALPNAIAPVFVSVAFAIATAILLESALSFLGIGVPPDTVSWGSLLSAGRQQFQAWWLVVFPGTAIFITVTAFNLIGEGLRDAIDPK